MSETPISPLRQRMLEDMAVRKFGEKTRRDYIRHVDAFASFLGRSPERQQPTTCVARPPSPLLPPRISPATPAERGPEMRKRAP
jgi:hypothetical protein